MPTIDITKFKDIQSSVTIEVDFLFYFIVLTISILAFSFILFILRKKKIVALTPKEEALKSLQELDFNSEDTKQLVYDFTLLAKESLDDKNQDILQNLLVELEPYKYQSHSKKPDDKIIKQMKEYIKICSL